MDVWQPKTSRATRRKHMVIDDPVPEVRFSDEEADTRVVLHALHAHKNDSVMHSDLLRLMSLSYCLLIAKNCLWKGATWKREEARTFYATSPR